MAVKDLIELLESNLPSGDKGIDYALRSAISGIEQQQDIYDALDDARRKTNEKTLAYLEEFCDKSLLPCKALPDAARKMRDELARVRKERDEAIEELVKLKTEINI